MPYQPQSKQNLDNNSFLFLTSPNLTTLDVAMNFAITGTGLFACVFVSTCHVYHDN